MGSQDAFGYILFDDTDTLHSNQKLIVTPEGYDRWYTYKRDVRSGLGGWCKMERLDRHSSSSVTLRPTETPGRFWLLASGKDFDHAKVSSSANELFKFFHEFTGRTDIEFQELLTIADWKPNVRMVDTFRKGRVLLAEDAAHVHNPAGAQGMNSGVMDSFNLGWKLSLVHKGLSPESLLDTYTEERLPVIAQMLNMTTKLFKDNISSAGALEDRWKRPEHLNQLGVNYRWSSILVDERKTRPEDAADERLNTYGPAEDSLVHAGDRAPEAPGLVDLKLGAKTSLFEVFNPACHTVLVFSNSSEEAKKILDGLQQYPPSVTRSVVILPSSTSDAACEGYLQDADGNAYKGYQITPGDTVVVLVRPDGVVGAIVRGIDGVKKYFGGILN